MTYCCGILVRDGMVMIADTRTNAGLDNISTFRKLHVFRQPGERVLALAASGNLSISQSVVSMLNEGIENPEDGEVATLMNAPTMFQAAQRIERRDDFGVLVRHHPHFLQVDADVGQVLGDIADVLVLGAPGQDLVADHQDGGGNHVGFCARLVVHWPTPRPLLWSNAVARTPLPLKPTPRQTAIFAGFSAAVAGQSFASL